jgi:exodeoxyribonuclease VII large subunit
LWAFNDEALARAIAACPVPVVSGVGHETDFTIADFVADVRAPTPSAAAELVSPDKLELQRLLAGYQLALAQETLQRVNNSRDRLQQRQWILARLSPQGQINNARQQVDLLLDRATRNVRHQLVVQQQQVKNLTGRLAALDPLATLSRGYAIVQKGDRLISSASQVSPGDDIVIRLHDGEIDAEVRGG